MTPEKIKREQTKKEAKPEKKAVSPARTLTKTTVKREKPVKVKKTKIIVKYDCGIHNSLYIRGEGVTTLSWEKGQLMQNIAADEWSWETERPCTHVQFKILLNDEQYENGPNHTTSYGTTEVISPGF